MLSKVASSAVSSVSPSLCSAIVPAALRLLGRRTIVVGRDGSNWNTAVLMVPQAEEWMIERFGKYHRTAKPGLNFAIPILESVAYKRSLKENAVRIKPQTAITKDNVHVKLDGAVYMKVENTFQAAYGVEDPEMMVSVIAQSAMRKEVGNLELDDLFLEREKLNANIALALDQTTTPWGIRVLRYEIADILVDQGTREAMERQSNAERLRRAEVLESEGYRQRLINKSEGDRQSAINHAEGEAESMRLKAHAQATLIRTIAEAEAESTRLNAAANADALRAVAAAVNEPGGRDAVAQRLAEQYVTQLADMAKQSNMIIVPDKPNDINGVVATALGIQQATANSANQNMGKDAK
jgi:regulator of protease activity HflC (stomatin/prohibitin superfamily)